MSELTALVVDWGGVLTAPLEQVIPDWARAEGVDHALFREVLEGWAEQARRTGRAAPTHLLERGELAEAEFEVLLVEELARRGARVPADGLLTRMLSGLAELEPTMVGAVRAARRAGTATALLSNSWGECYPDALWDDLFDVVVISGRVGMRKPEPEIFALTADRLGVAPEQCVMVDDLERNVRAAADAGMTAVHHVDPAVTLATLSRLLGH